MKLITTTIAVVSITTSLAFVAAAVAIIDDNFAMRAFAQVTSRPPSAPQLTIRSQGPNPSPNQQAIIHACDNTVGTPGRSPFCSTQQPLTSTSTAILASTLASTSSTPTP